MCFTGGLLPGLLILGDWIEDWGELAYGVMLLATLVAFRRESDLIASARREWAMDCARTEPLTVCRWQCPYVT